MHPKGLFYYEPPHLAQPPLEAATFVCFELILPPKVNNFQHRRFLKSTNQHVKIAILPVFRGTWWKRRAAGGVTGRARVCVCVRVKNINTRLLERNFVDFFQPPKPSIAQDVAGWWNWVSDKIFIRVYRILWFRFCFLFIDELRGVRGTGKEGRKLQQKLGFLIADKAEFVANQLAGTTRANYRKKGEQMFEN